MNHVTITIAGPAGSGKSTLAQSIARSLSNRHGIDVAVIDEDNASNGWDHIRIGDALEALADRTTVTITTTQVKREAI